MTWVPREFRWPGDILPSSVRFFPLSRAATSTSRYTGTTRSAGALAEPWTCEMQIGPLAEEQWRRLRSFLARLQGSSNIVRLWDPAGGLPLGAAAGINLASYAAAGTGQFTDATLFTDGTGFLDGSAYGLTAAVHRRGETTLLVGGLVASQALALAEGDMLEVGGYLHLVTSDCASDASGVARLPIRPGLRVDVPTGSLVSFVWPTSPFVLAGGFDGFAITPPAIADDIALQFVEATP